MNLIKRNTAFTQFDIFLYFYFFSEFIRSHTFDTIKFPHFILFHFTSKRADTLHMNLFEKFRLNFLVSAFVSRSLFRIGGLFHRFRNVFCLCFFLSILPNSIAIRLKCRCVCCTAVYRRFLTSFPQRKRVLVFRFLVFNFNRRPFCIEFVQVQMHSSLKRMK